MRSAETCLCTEANSIRRVLRPPPGSEAMCVGHRLRPLIRTNSTAAGRAPLEVDKNRGKCPNFVYASPPQYAKKAPRPRRGASYYPSFHAGSHIDQRIDILSLQRIQNVALVPRQHVFAGGCFKLSATFGTWCRQVVPFKQVNDVLCCRNRIFANDCTRMNDE